VRAPKTRAARVLQLGVAAKIFIGTAGWGIPRANQRQFPRGDSLLARYARVFPAVEINSTFYRTHKAATFERWAATVPRTFRFSIKMPGAITHERRLEKTSRQLDSFFADLEPLGQKLGCVLAQLPPSLAFDAPTVRGFLKTLRKRFGGGVALEPRHASWFDARADRLLDDFDIARVAADPPRADGDGVPGGSRKLVYFRLHGSPRLYYSPYDAAYLEALAGRLIMLRRRRIPAWCILDNTASGAATANALTLREHADSG
jgi:uncharacterized protein YecE (DUF72 family)